MNYQSRNNHKPGKSSLVIGYITISIWDSVGQALWSGVSAAVLERGANLICFPGGRLLDPQGFSSPSNIIYNFADINYLDGLVSWASAVGGSLSKEETVSFHKRYKPLPMSSISLPMEGVPTVLIENSEGIKELVSHFVEIHGMKRIAFIRGPGNHFYSEERFAAYINTLKKYGIQVDPKLITPPYPFENESGANAIKLFFDKRKLKPGKDIQAIMAASDQFSISALEELNARGVRVPQDIALAGFNDAVDGRFAATPLTTVRAPFYEAGYKAAEILLDSIEGKSVPGKIILPSQMVVRKSCGCKSLAIQQVSNYKQVQEVSGIETGMKITEIFIHLRVPLVNSVLDVFEENKPEITEIEKLIDNFIIEIDDGPEGTFLSAVEQMLRRLTALNSFIGTRSFALMQNVISLLRMNINPWLSLEKREYAEVLWQQARIATGEAAEHLQARLALQVEKRESILRAVGQSLLTTFDIKELMSVFEEYLPRLDIPSAYLSLYEDPENPEQWARLMLVYNEKGRKKLGAKGVRFLTNQLVPKGMWPGRQFSFVVKPLFFQAQQIGFIVCEVGPLEAKIYETLRVQISNVLQGYFLIQQIEERSAALMRQQYILDTFMKNIPDCIYFKDLKSRITRANQAMANLHGFDSPEKLIGKTDFDLFDKEPAQVKYDNEQEIIKTGTPFLSVEEQNGVGKWAVATKMPLRDEHGKIIGTFGISHDITDIKNAQAELMRQERLSALGQLTATVAHEIRNPLSTVRTSIFSISLAVERNQIDRIQRTLELAERNIIRCDNIINELLDYTRDRVLQLKPVQLDKWLGKLMDEQKIPSNITCVRKFAANIKVSIDSESLRRAIINVINNAVEAMQDMSALRYENTAKEESGDKIGTLIVRTGIKKERVEISVKDTGCGIPEEILGELFKPLFSTKNFGVGLGLTIIKEIIEQHEGGIEIKSKEEGGTEVILWLPNVK